MSEILNKSFDTSDLDPVVALSPMSYFIAEALEIVPPLSPKSVRDYFEIWEVIGESALDFLKPVWFEAEEKAGFHMDWIPGLAPIPKSDFSEEDEWIYAVYLLYLARGSKWQSLSTEQRDTIRMRLKEWIKDPSLEKKKIKRTEPWITMFVPAQLLPIDLLETVGYEVITQETDEEGTT
jgi:hypothetical protein